MLNLAIYQTTYMSNSQALIISIIMLVSLIGNEMTQNLLVTILFK